MKKVEKELELLDKKLTNESFLSRAPQEVVEEKKNDYNQYIALKQRVEKGLSRVREWMNS